MLMPYLVGAGFALVGFGLAVICWGVGMLIAMVVLWIAYGIELCLKLMKKQLRS